MWQRILIDFVVSAVGPPELLIGCVLPHSLVAVAAVASHPSGDLIRVEIAGNAFVRRAHAAIDEAFGSGLYQADCQNQN